MCSCREAIVLTRDIRPPSGTSEPADEAELEELQGQAQREKQEATQRKKQEANFSFAERVAEADAELEAMLAIRCRRGLRFPRFATAAIDCACQSCQVGMGASASFTLDSQRH